MPGPSLEQAVREHGQLPADSVRALAEGLLRALRGIHAAGIVHRDLKPSNVLLTVDGPRVIDFGIARALQVSVESLLTSTGMVIGSPGFMAPEQILGEETGTGADVFALGCVLMYAATGQLPFGNGASNQHAVMYRIVESAPDLTGVGDAPLRELIGRCLTKKPAERPGVDVLLADIGTSESPGAALRGGAWLPPQLLARLARQAAVLLDADVPGAEVAGASGAVGAAGAAGAGEASVARPDVATADLRPEPVGGAEVGAGDGPVRDPRAEAGPVPVCVPEAERAPEAEGVREPGAKAGSEAVREPGVVAGSEPVRGPEAEAVSEPGAAAGSEPVRDPKAEAVRASEADPGPKGAAGAEAAPGASPAPASPPPSALVVSAGESGGKAPRRRRHMWVVAAAVLAVLATGSTVAFLQHRPGGGADGRDTDAAAPAGTGDGPSAPPSAGPTGGGEDKDDKDGKGKEKPEKEGDGDGKGQEKGETSGSGGAGEASASGGGGSGSGGSDGSAASASGGSGSGAPGGGSGSGSGAGGSGSGSGSSSGSGSGSGSGTASKPPTTDPDPPATDNRVPQHFVGTWTRASQYDALQPHTVVIRRAAPGQVAVTLIADVQGTGHCEYTAKLTSVADGGQRINVGTATVDKARSTGMCRDGDPSFFYTVAGSGILHDVGPAHGSGYRYNRA